MLKINNILKSIAIFSLLMSSVTYAGFSARSSNNNDLLAFFELWTEDYKPYLSVQCDLRNQSDCERLCRLDDNFSCQLPMKVCRDCIGTSLLVTDIFEGMGVRYKNTGKEIRLDEFVDFLRLGQFVTFSAKSVYNHVDNYDSLNLQMRFNGLCPFEPRNPAIVFFDLRPKSNVLNKVRYLACDGNIFEMDDKALIDNDGQLKKFKKQFIFTAF